MSQGHPRRVGQLVSLTFAVAAATWTAAAIFLPAEAAAQEGCVPAAPPLQPEEPLELNTVHSKDLIKTVVMEKDVFVCFDLAGTMTEIVDLQTFIEIVERVTRAGIKLVERRVEVVRCIKDLRPGGSFTCTAEERQLTPLNAPPLARCVNDGQRDVPRPRPPRDPVEMNTIAVGPFVKTIKVEKEVFECPNPLIIDVYLFTEIVERPARLATGELTLRPIQKQFEGIACFKQSLVPTAGQVTVFQCRDFSAGAVQLFEVPEVTD